MIACLVQARISSSRLPNKVMKEVLGKPLIAYVLERAQACSRIDKVILVTSENPENDVLCEYVQSIGYEVFRGSEDNVLQRYYLAAKQYKAEYIIRLTGDCPLVDPQNINLLITEMTTRGLDYVYLGPTFAEGLDGEMMTFKALEKAYEQATLPSEKEHVTQYFHKHEGIFNICRIDNDVDDSRYRIVVDEPEDFEVVKTIIEELYAKQPRVCSFADIKGFLDTRPELMKTNAHIIRNEGLLKSLEQDQVVNT